METSEASRERAVARTSTNQNILGEIAATSSHRDARLAALAHLEDQDVLARVALEDDDTQVRTMALVKVTDQDVLARVALEDADVRIRKQAIVRLRDEIALTQVAREDENAANRDAATDRLNRLRGMPLVVPTVAPQTETGTQDVSDTAADDALPDIVELLAQNKVEVTTEGSGIDSVSVAIRRRTAEPIDLRIPVGSFFVSARTSAQNMVATSTSEISLTDYDWHTVSVPAACANRPRDIPGQKDTFTIRRSPQQAELARLMPLLDRARVDYETRQAAVWIVTDNANYADLGSLVSSSTYSQTKTRAIGEPEAALALKLCADAGIAIMYKRIGRDKTAILRGLDDGDLKTWLEGVVFNPVGTGPTVVPNAKPVRRTATTRAEIDARDAERLRGYRAAAEQGDVRAQRMVGVSYLMGRGVPQDAVVAYGWFALALANGDAPSSQLQSMAELRMSAEEVRTAQTWAETRRRATPQPSIGEHVDRDPGPRSQETQKPEPPATKGIIKTGNRNGVLLPGGQIVYLNDVVTTTHQGKPVLWHVTSVTSTGATFAQVEHAQTR